MSSISQGQSIWQRTDEGKIPTIDCLTFGPTTTLWQRCLELSILYSRAPPRK